jgi:hypothetical protein
MVAEMTRDEHRAKCIEAILHALFHSTELRTMEETATAALDALHGIARVVSIEATEEMLAVRTAWEAESDARDTWRNMSPAGDITKPPEEKP